MTSRHSTGTYSIKCVQIIRSESCRLSSLVVDYMWMSYVIITLCYLLLVHSDGQCSLPVSIGCTFFGWCAKSWLDSATYISFCSPQPREEGEDSNSPPGGGTPGDRTSATSVAPVKKKPSDFIFGKVIGEGSYSTVSFRVSYLWSVCWFFQLLHALGMSRYQNLDIYRYFFCRSQDIWNLMIFLDYEWISKCLIGSYFLIPIHDTAWLFTYFDCSVWFLT